MKIKTVAMVAMMWCVMPAGVCLAECPENTYYVGQTIMHPVSTPNRIYPNPIEFNLIGTLEYEERAYILAIVCVRNGDMWLKIQKKDDTGMIGFIKHADYMGRQWY